MSYNYYETWYIPYGASGLNTQTGLIEDDKFELHWVVWNSYLNTATSGEEGVGEEDAYVNGAEAPVVSNELELAYTLEEDSTFVDYSLAWGNTDHTGSYPLAQSCFDHSFHGQLLQKCCSGIKSEEVLQLPKMKGAQPIQP